MNPFGSLRYSLREVVRNKWRMRRTIEPYIILGDAVCQMVKNCDVCFLNKPHSVSGRLTLTFPPCDMEAERIVKNAQANLCLVSKG